jgi:hypothetical protein
LPGWTAWALPAWAPSPFSASARTACILAAGKPSPKSYRGEKAALRVHWNNGRAGDFGRLECRAAMRRGHSTTPHFVAREAAPWCQKLPHEGPRPVGAAEARLPRPASCLLLPAGGYRPPAPANPQVSTACARMGRAVVSLPTNWQGNSNVHHTYPS